MPPHAFFTPKPVRDSRGRLHASIRASARALGCSAQSVARDLQRGIAPFPRRREHLHGEVSAAARECGLSPAVVHGRMARGATLVQALARGAT